MAHFVQNEVTDYRAVIKQQVSAKNQVKVTVDTLRRTAQPLVQQIMGRKIDLFFEAVNHPERIALTGEIFMNMFLTDISHRSGIIEPLTRRFQLGLGAIGGKDAKGNGVITTIGNQLIQQDGDGVGLLTGGAARRPDPRAVSRTRLRLAVGDAVAPAPLLRGVDVCRRDRPRQ